MTPPFLHRLATHPARTIARLMAGAALCAVAAQGFAQDYPSKTVQLVVPFAAGGPSDALARALGREMAAGLGQTVIVVNQPGAAGNLGGKAAAQAQPDGHTVLFTLDAALTSNPALYGSRMGFDPAKDLRPVTTLVSYGQTLAVHPSLKVSTLPQFLELARKQDLTYASAGNGSTGHLGMALLADIAGLKMTHIPYKGAAPALTDLIGGQVQSGFLVTPGVAPHVKSGRLVALAVSGKKRSGLLPQIPTVTEAGLPGATLEFSMMLMAPAKTPDAIVKRLNDEAHKAMKSASVQKLLKDNDYDAVSDTPEQAAAHLAAMTKQMADLIAKLGIKAD